MRFIEWQWLEFLQFIAEDGFVWQQLVLRSEYQDTSKRLQKFLGLDKTEATSEIKNSEMISDDLSGGKGLDHIHALTDFE